MTAPWKAEAISAPKGLYSRSIKASPREEYPILSNYVRILFLSGWVVVATAPFLRPLCMDDDLNDERTRAEDVLLGSLGYGEGARVVSVHRTSEGYRGKGAWEDGEEFEFESEGALEYLEEWALGILLRALNGRVINES